MPGAPVAGPPGRRSRRSLSTVISTPSRPACTRTVARAPGACLTTLVSASWTMRYAVSEAAGGSAATSPVTASDTGIPAARTVPAPALEVADAGGGNQAGRLAVVVAE